MLVPRLGLAVREARAAPREKACATLVEAAEEAIGPVALTRPIYGFVESIAVASNLSTSSHSWVRTRLGHVLGLLGREVVGVDRSGLPVLVVLGKSCRLVRWMSVKCTRRLTFSAIRANNKSTDERK